MRNQEGTGKHPHKSSKEPKHTAESKSGSESQSDDLKQREYRDAQGNVHHHTRTSEAYREREGGGRDSGDEHGQEDEEEAA
jgi:hypothetical protein